MDGRTGGYRDGGQGALGWWRSEVVSVCPRGAHEPGSQSASGGKSVLGSEMWELSVHWILVKCWKRL